MFGRHSGATRYIDKKTLYARYGAREYWIVDPAAKTLERYVLGDAGFNPPELS